MIETIRVQVGLTIKEYPADIAGYGEHLANGLATLTLGQARQQARRVLAADGAPDWLAAVDFWVTMDESGLAYRATFTRNARHRIVAAAPLPGPNNVRDLYDVDGYGCTWAGHQDAMDEHGWCPVCSDE